MDGKELENRAIRFLAARDHSREELRRKLAARGADDSDLLERVLDSLERHNYLNEGRFVEQYVESRKRKGFGPRRIRMELRERGVTGSLVDDWLDENSRDWADRLREVVDAKYGKAPASNRKEQARRARFLESRGFPGHLIGDFLWGGE